MVFQLIVKSIDRVLKSAQVTSLAAIYFPNIFKHFSTRFAQAKKAFDDTRDLMKSAINEHIQKRTKEIPECVGG